MRLNFYGCLIVLWSRLAFAGDKSEHVAPKVAVVDDFPNYAGTTSNYQMAKAAIAFVESRGDVCARNSLSTASGKYQFVRAWDKFFLEYYGKKWTATVPKRNASQAVKRQAEIEQDKMFDIYYELRVAPWISRVRHMHITKKLNDIDLLALYHRQGQEGAELWLRTGTDPMAGRIGNKQITYYMASVRHAFGGNPIDGLKIVHSGKSEVR